MMIDVLLPRPRHHTMVTQELFLAIKAQMVVALREETLFDREEQWM